MGKFNKQFFVKLLCEFLASLFVEFIGCSVHVKSVINLASKSSKVNINNIIAPTFSALVYALSWGAGVLASTQAFRIVSGAHINPCISIASMILKNVEIIDGLFYILSQLVGSALGFGIAYGLYRNKDFPDKHFCVTVISMDPWWKSILLEFYMTGAWVLAMCASWHSSNETMLESISLRIGLVVVAATLVGAPFTGSGMNPFRSLWPAIAASYWKYLYVYVVVPPVTAILLALAWRFLYLMGKDETKVAEGE